MASPLLTAPSMNPCQSARCSPPNTMRPCDSWRSGRHRSGGCVQSDDRAHAGTATGAPAPMDAGERSGRGSRSLADALPRAAMPTFALALLAALLLAPGLARAQEPSFSGLGDLSGGSSFTSFARGVSADGTVVVGRSISVNGFEAFRWTQTDGMVGLGDLPSGGFSRREWRLGRRVGRCGHWQGKWRSVPLDSGGRYGWPR